MIAGLWISNCENVNLIQNKEKVRLKEWKDGDGTAATQISEKSVLLYMMSSVREQIYRHTCVLGSTAQHVKTGYLRSHVGMLIRMWLQLCVCVCDSCYAVCYHSVCSVNVAIKG